MLICPRTDYEIPRKSKLGVELGDCCVRFWLQPWICQLFGARNGSPRKSQIHRQWRFGYDTSSIRRRGLPDWRSGSCPLCRNSEAQPQTVGISGIPQLDSGLVTEILVRAGQPFYGTFQSATTSGACRIAFEFVPEIGRDYQVTFSWDGYKEYCDVKLANVGSSVESSSKAIDINFRLKWGGRRYIDPTSEREPLAPGRCIDALTKTYWS